MAQMTVCRRGHDLTDPATFYRERDGGKRCRECKRIDYQTRAKQQWHKKRLRDDTRQEVAKNGLHLEMLGLIQERERCATWWEREAVDRRYAELQRLLGTVEA